GFTATVDARFDRASFGTQVLTTTACKSCICTKSFPPMCICSDVTDFYYERCNYNDGSKAGAHQISETM
ncbi:trypsin inhibitor, partial [Trifolium pratense]